MLKAKDCYFNYVVSWDDPSSHFLRIETYLKNLNPDDETINLILPVWRPGRYMIFDFAGDVQEFNCSDADNNKLKWKKIDKSTWQINKKGLTNLIVYYKVYADDFNNRTKGLNEEHCFINPAAVFMYSDSYRSELLSLRVNINNEWHVTTGLEEYQDDKFYFTAENYDYFIDCPLEIGNQKDYEFIAGDKKHIISFFGDANYNIEQMKIDFGKIISENLKFWGKLPYDKYIFIVHCTPFSGGGTEHINSTVVGVKPESFESKSGYKSFLRLISHEFFHTWNVKQIKPAGITPFDFTKENYLEELWIAEGSTSYYDGLNLLRAGLYKDSDFINEITGAVDEDRNRAGNKIQSLAESSFDAWIKFWKRRPQFYISESDYYSKGFHVSMILDLDIRYRSKNKYSLDDIFRNLFEQYPKDIKGYTNNDFKNICSHLTGESYDQFFDDYIYGVKPIDWEKYLNYAGLKLLTIEDTTTPFLGLKIVKDDDKILITDVVDGSAAKKYYLEKGDEILSLDFVRYNFTNLKKRISKIREGDVVTFTISRDDVLYDFTVSLETPKKKYYEIKKDEISDELQKEIYSGWLNNK